MEGMILLILISAYFIFIPIFLILNVIRLHQRIDEIEKFLGRKTVINQQEPEIEIKPEIKDVSLKSKTINWEIEFGRKYFYWTGIFIFLFGIALFLKYAFVNKWFNETTKIVLGILSGFVLIGLGSRFISRYRQFALGLIGAGIVSLYLSIFVACNLYRLITYLPAFFAMILITGFGVFLTIKYDSIFLSILAFLGGFGAPIILTGFRASLFQAFTGLSLYLLLLNIGNLAINYFKPWRILLILSTHLTYGIFWMWIARFYHPSVFALVLVGIALFFFLYLYFLISRFNKPYRIKEVDYYLIIFNSAVFAGFVFYLVHGSFPLYKWLTCIVLAFIHTIAAMSLQRKENYDEGIVFLLLGASLIFLTLCFPFYFNGTNITISWVCEGLLIFWLGLKIPSTFLRIFGYFIFLLSVGRYSVIDAFIIRVYSSGFIKMIHFFNERFLTGFAVSVSILLSGLLALRRKEILKTEEKFLPSVLIILSNFTLFLALSIEVYKWMDDVLTSDAANVALSIFWAFYGLILLAVGLLKKIKLIRYFAFSLIGLTVTKVLFFDLFRFGIHRIVVSVIVGAILLIVGFIYHRRKEM
ncbi:MAG: DUF2339 domain-containing protein [Candidatus Omnitrophica bacterium]|nr:DUF2339 domain-containing protein [Candidatus Omnitrophota bacterium]